MPDILIHNETEYSLTTAILEQIKRDALEYFGESVRSIRVQYGIDRHAFNAKTGEIRFAFSPGDFGLVDIKVPVPDTYLTPRNIPRIDDEEEGEADETTFAAVDIEAEAEEEVEVEEEVEAEAPTFRSLEEELDEGEEEEEEAFSGLEEELEESEDEDRDVLYDDEEYR